jgi:hypothetical protein
VEDAQKDEIEPLPFDTYPSGGRTLLGKVSGDNCRKGYGLRFLELTGQTRCAYCGLDLVGKYEHWLTMALDHVVPDSVCKSWGLSQIWKEDYSNRVLCCTACNTFGNRYRPTGVDCPLTLEAFVTVQGSDVVT